MPGFPDSSSALYLVFTWFPLGIFLALLHIGIGLSSYAQKSRALLNQAVESAIWGLLPFNKPVFAMAQAGATWFVQLTNKSSIIGAAPLAGLEVDGFWQRFVYKKANRSRMRYAVLSGRYSRK